jgi:hypothetical protein
MERINQWLTLVANLGVIAGIVFLAYEIQQNTAAVRSSTYQSWNESGNSYFDFVAEHAQDLARIGQYSDPAQLSSAEQYSFMANAFKNFNTWETTFLQHRAGALDDDVFLGRVRGNRDAWAAPINRFYLHHGWQEFKSSAFSDDFVKFMEKEIVRSVQPSS